MSVLVLAGDFEEYVDHARRWPEDRLVWHEFHGLLEGMRIDEVRILIGWHASRPQFVGDYQYRHRVWERARARYPYAPVLSEVSKESGDLLQTLPVKHVDCYPWRGGELNKPNVAL